MAMRAQQQLAPRLRHQRDLLHLVEAPASVPRSHFRLESGRHA
jgi:hypothetical protein